MKKTAWYCGALVLAVLNAVYLALTADSFYLEYVKDEFVYWGYPQWGWMYSDPKIYLWFNVLYLAFLLLLFAAGLFLIGKKRLKTGTALLLLPLLTASFICRHITGIASSPYSTPNAPTKTAAFPKANGGCRLTRCSVITTLPSGNG